MAAKKIIFYPENVLRTKAAEINQIDKEVKKLVTDLKDTLVKEEGLGLAANQIGVPLRVFVFWLSDQENQFIQEVINPTIKPIGGYIPSEEGCLSIPGFRDTIKRVNEIELTGLNLNGELFTIKLEGLQSRCAQHELDHLNGILFVDHLAPLQKRNFLDWVSKQPWYKTGITKT